MRATWLCIVLAGIALLYLPASLDNSIRPNPDDKQSAITARHADKSNLRTESISISTQASADAVADEPADLIDKPDPRPQAILWGTMQTDTGSTLPGAKISLYSATENENHVTRSGGNGEFLFQYLRPAEDYHISVSPRGMYKRYQRVIEIDSNETYSEIVVEALPVAPLSGRIVDVGLAIDHHRARVFRRNGAG